ncbi:MAG: antibiotic biosynthesis monooxygenase (ABM) superfamily enzyme [Pseudohongiellaceae bacterium]
MVLMQTPVPSPVTTIFSRNIRAGFEVQYEEWLAGISQMASRFTGNQGTTILRPSEGRDQYIAITQFDSTENLELWIHSTERDGWLAKLRSIDICREEVMSLAGMERWFTLPDQGAAQLPPRYKTATLVLLGLYPVVLLLNLTLVPLLSGFPEPLQVLTSLFVSVTIMVWIVLPRLTGLFSGWLHPRGRPSPTQPTDSQPDS